MKRTFFLASIAVCVGMLAAPAPCPINGYAHGLQPHQLKHDTEASLEAQQNDQKTIGEVGNVPMKTEQNPIDTSPADQAGKAALSAASSNPVNQADSQKATALQVLNQAELNRNSHPKSPFMIGLVVLGFVGAGLFGVKRWADSNIPEMDGEPRTKRASW